MSASCTDPTLQQSRRDALRADVQDQLLKDIPLAGAMQLRIGAWNGDVLRMDAPLVPNVNDKGCAFGGSLVSVMTLACWALVKLAAEQAGEDCDIYVQDSTVRYLRPVWSDFSAEAGLVAQECWTSFFATLDARGKARLNARCEVRLDDGSVACSLEARFVALKHAATARAADAAQSQIASPN